MKPQTLPQWLAHNRREHPQAVGHRYKLRGIWQEFTWSGIYDTVRRIAYGLLALGLERGQTLLLIGENGPRFTGSSGPQWRWAQKP